MRYQLDQSGRIEETNRDTIIGLAAKESSFALRVPARVKRQLLELFRRQGKSKVFPVVVFGIVAGLAVKKSGFDVAILEIDAEYPGHGPLIKNLIRQTVGQQIDCRFKRIGKKSWAHYAAYGVFARRKKADAVLGPSEVVKHLEIKKRPRSQFWD